MSQIQETSFDIDVSKNEEELITHITEILEGSHNHFLARMAKVCSEYDIRAEVSEDSLVVEEVILSNLGTDTITGTLCVTYDWSSHYGCKDMSGQDSVDDTWEFSITDNKFIVHLVIPEERYDEL